MLEIIIHECSDLLPSEHLVVAILLIVPSQLCIQKVPQLGLAYWSVTRLIVQTMDKQVQLGNGEAHRTET